MSVSKKILIFISLMMIILGIITMLIDFTVFFEEGKIKTTKGKKEKKGIGEMLGVALSFFAK